MGWLITSSAGLRGLLGLEVFNTQGEALAKKCVQGTDHLEYE
jgi:hypothetical protein